MPPEPTAGDPWRKAPVGELQEQLLPRWFVLLVVAAIPLAVAVLALALTAGRTQEVPAAERRPPPVGNLTHDVGEVVTGEAAPTAWPASCPLLEGLQIAGLEADVETLHEGLDAVCDVELPTEEAAALDALAEAGAIVRFAVFERTAVDSAVDLGADPPVVLLNGRFTATEPSWIAPLIVHDAVMAAGDPRSVETALAARRIEHEVCQQLFVDEAPSRGCDDAAAVLALPDPLQALRDAGYR